MTDPQAGVRVRAPNDQAIRRGGEHVLYWMIAARRPSHNFALDRAIAWARALGKLLLGDAQLR